MDAGRHTLRADSDHSKSYLCGRTRRTDSRRRRTLEVLFPVTIGAKSWMSYLTRHMIPTLAANILGGVSFVSALNQGYLTAILTVALAVPFSVRTTSWLPAATPCGTWELT